MNPNFVDIFEQRFSRSKQQKNDKEKSISNSGSNEKERIKNQGFYSEDEVPSWSLLNQRYLVEQINKVKLCLLNYCMSGSTYLEDQDDDGNTKKTGSKENKTGQIDGDDISLVEGLSLTEDEYPATFTNESEIKSLLEKENDDTIQTQNKESKSALEEQRNSIDTSNNTAANYDGHVNGDHNNNNNNNDDNQHEKIPFVSALDHLCYVFNLTEFERYILVLCAGVELDSSFGKLCSRINSGKIGAEELDEEIVYNKSKDNKEKQPKINVAKETRRVNKDRLNEQGIVTGASHSNINTPSNQGVINNCPNFAMALFVLPEPHWSAISPRSTIREYDLIEIDNDNFMHFPVVMRPIKIPERVLNYLTGVFYIDKKIENISNSLEEDFPLGHKQISDDSGKLDEEQDIEENFADYYMVTESYNKIISTAVNIFKDFSFSFGSQRSGKTDESDLYPHFQTGKKYNRTPVIQLIGTDDISKLDICRIIFLKSGYRFVGIPATSIPENIEDQRSLTDTLSKESLLMDLGYYIYFTEDMEEGTRNNLKRFLDNSNNPVSIPLVVGIREENRRLKLANVLSIYLNVSKPSKKEQTRLWMQLVHKKNRDLEQKIIKKQFQQQQQQKQIMPVRKTKSGKTSKNKNKDNDDYDYDFFYSNQNFVDATSLIDKIVKYYDLNIYDIKSAVNQAYYSLYKDLDSEKYESSNILYNKIKQNFESVLLRSVKTLIQDKFPGFVERIDSDTIIDDLVLSQREKDLLKSIIIHVKHKSKVFGEWDFGSKTRRGSNTIALLHGPSGTGKTMAAESISNTLDLDMYRIDLSSVVSKYIGETEKNLNKVFAAAENGGCVLFFDEADALFGKRTAIKDSHDRYANIEINYLLQKLESNNNIVLTVLATNMKESMDDAFLRRIKFFVNFPFPGYESRVKIWEGIFPKKLPVSNLDYSLLGKLNLTGGQIRNIAEDAAFLAADNGVPLNMEHLKIATQNEYMKTGTMITNDNIWSSRGS
ncbi:MAG: ATP-binding protein [Candidatus Nitrosocosmicus sp.]